MRSDSIFSPELGEQVIKTLGRYARLPSKGVIAGQAVASALDEIKGKGSPVYNDIDIFLDQDRWKQHWPEDIERRLQAQLDEKGHRVRAPDHGRLADSVVYMHDALAHSDGYDRHVSVGHRSLYSIEHTRTEGLLNYVCVDWQYAARDELNVLNPHTRAHSEMRMLTDVFDLNCTQAAVDLETGRLHTSTLFDAYYRTRQLQVVTGFTPAHSLLRYLKKRVELGAYGDDATHLALARMLVRQAQGDSAVSQARRRAFREGRVGVGTKQVQEERARMRLPDFGEVGWQRAGAGVNSRPISFGRKYFNLYLKHQKLLNQHFMLTRHNRRDIWLLTSKTPADDADAEQTYVSPTMVALRFAEQQNAPPKKVLAQQAGLDELIRAMKDESGAAYALNKLAANFGREYLEGMEDANLRKRWLEVCPKHTEFFWPTMSLPFRDQITLIRRMRTEFKKVGIRDPWGALARAGSDWVRELLHDDEKWAQLIEEHAGTLEPLCTALPLPSELDGVAVRELTTSRDLLAEGTKQRHCVGSYTGMVRDRYCRVVSFALGDSSQDRSTAEWTIRVTRSKPNANELAAIAQVQFECNQHRGFANATPPEKLSAVEEKARVLMNQWASSHLPEAITLLQLTEDINTHIPVDDDIF